MCIVAIAWQIIPNMPLALLSNRDEFLARPTQPLHRWADQAIIAGRDQTGGGTWLGVNPTQNPNNPRWAVVLNIREAGAHKGQAPTHPTSRGQLVTNYLDCDMAPLAFAKAVDLKRYEGFSLILGDTAQAVMVNNRGQAPKRLAHGLYVFSNGGLVDDLNQPWFKCERLRGRVRQEVLPLMQDNSALSHWQAAALDVLADTTQASDTELPDTGVPQSIEQQLSSVCIPTHSMGGNLSMGGSYGTRVSSLLALYTNSGSPDSRGAGFGMLERSSDGSVVSIGSSD